jgi:hypothetical protein
VAFKATGRSPLDYLGKFLQDHEASGWTPADVVYVLKTAAREILPAAQLARRCMQLELFADWVVHKELDRSPQGNDAIATIAETLAQFDDHGEGANRWCEERLNNVISFGTLRLDLLAVCRRFALPEASFASWEAWQHFAVCLAFEVSGRPIALRDRGNNAKPAKARVSVSGMPPGRLPESVELICVEDDAVKGGPWWWAVTLEDTTRILVQVLFGGYRPEDFPVPANWRSPL